MSKSTAPLTKQLSVYEFGSELLSRNDLDPIYEMLYRANLPKPLLKRWCLAYWFFYHAGVASRIAASPDFYKVAQQGHDEKWPRGAERRHFRGHSSLSTIAWFGIHYPDPTHAIDAAIQPTFQGVKRAVERWPLFGPWISFKVADMIDRVLQQPVDFSDCVLDIYAEPVKGGKIVAQQWGEPNLPLSEVIERLKAGFGNCLAPPDYRRPLNVQEIETVLCKYKSHLNGHYPPGKDIAEIRHGLHGWGDLAKHLSKHLPA